MRILRNYIRPRDDRGEPVNRLLDRKVRNRFKMLLIRRLLMVIDIQCSCILFFWIESQN